MSKTANKFNSDLIYGKNVVLSIIALAAKEITGVHSLSGKGVKAEINGGNVDVDITLIIAYSYTVSDVAYRVQENIKRSIETMTAYKINAVNVTVAGISFDGSEH